MKPLRAVAIGILPLILLLFAGYIYLVYKNNVDAKPPSKQEIQQALDKSINWVLENQDELIKINNSVLWWFLDESAYLTENHKLSKLIRRYRNTVLDKNSVWTGYWIKKPPFTYIFGSLDYMEKYQKFFVYALSCDTELGEEKVIQDQLNINFCDWHPYYSSCITHQMMGVRLLQIKRCGNQEQNKQLSSNLANLIESQLIWDPRIGDVYIQRALMLVESGNKNMVKSVWIRKILNEQKKNGGWSTYYNLFTIYNETKFVFGYKHPGIINKEKTSLHTTAQAIYLLSLLLEKN